MNIADFQANQVQLWIAVFIRVSAIMALLPFFGSWQIPIQAKAGLSLVLTYMLFPLIMAHGTIAVPLGVPLFVIALLKELSIGLVIGFAASFLFVGVQFAGELMDTLMGFSFVQVVDPLTDTEVTTMGQLQILIFSIVFLLMNGHYFLLLSIKKSFEVIPLFGGHFSVQFITEHFSSMCANIFVLAVKLAAPVLVPLFVTTVTLGVVARTVPQLNVFFVGLPLTITVGLGCMIVVLPLLVGLFKKIVEGMIGDIWKLLYIMA